MMRVVEQTEKVPLTGQCVCACYKAAAFAAIASEASTLIKVKFLVKFFRLLLQYTLHLQARSVCAIFLSTRDYIDFYPRDAVLARY